MRHQRVEHRLQRQVRLGLEPIDDRVAELFQRPDDLGPVLGRPGVARAHHDYRLAVHVLGQERQWRRELELEDRRELVGRGGRDLAIEAQYLRRVFERVEDRPGEHDRPDRMQAVLERRDDAEVTAAAAHSPEQIGVLVLAGGDELAVRRDEVDGEQVVDRRAVLAHQPADPAPEGQPRNARVAHDSTHRRKPEELGLAVELAPQHARFGARRPGLRVDVNAFHRRQVDHEPAVAERMPADPVAPERTATSRSRSRA